MASDAEELLAHSALTSPEPGKDSQYDDHLGTQIPLDIADFPKPDEADLVQLDTAAGQSQIYQSDFANNENHDKVSTAMIPQRNKDIINIGNIDSDVGDTSAPAKIGPQSNTSSKDAPSTIIKQEDPISDVRIHDLKFEPQVIDLCESDGDQDAMDVEEDSHLRIKTEESDVPFPWTDMGSDIIELSDSNQEEMPELSSKEMRSLRRTSSNHSSEVSSSPRVHASGNVTGAGAIFRGSRGQALNFTEPTNIDYDDSDISDQGAR